MVAGRKDDTSKVILREELAIELAEANTGEGSSLTQNEEPRSPTGQADEEEQAAEEEEEEPCCSWRPEAVTLAVMGCLYAVFAFVTEMAPIFYMIGAVVLARPRVSRSGPRDTSGSPPRPAARSRARSFL